MRVFSSSDWPPQLATASESPSCSLNGARVIDLQEASGNGLSSDMTAFIAFGERGLDLAERAVASGQGRVDGKVQFAPPLRLRKNVFCTGRNYKAHIEEGFRARGQE